VSWARWAKFAIYDGLVDLRVQRAHNGLGQLLASAVLLSMDHEHGTDYLQHFVQQNFGYARSSVS